LLKQLTGVRGLAVAAGLCAMAMTAAVSAQGGPDPRFLRTDATGLTLFDGLLTLPRRDTYRVRSAHSRIEQDGPLVEVEVEFTAPEMAGAVCKLRVGQTAEDDIEEGRAALREVLEDFDRSRQTPNSALRSRHRLGLTSGNSNSINNGTPYLSTYASSESGGHEEAAYWVIPQNGTLDGVVKECTAPSSADRRRMSSDFPVRLRRP
jgi:hypothetical protein